MQIARDNGMLIMAHCENGDVIDTLVEQALAEGHTTPEWHALTRPGWGAVESTLRVAGMASAADASVYIVHMNMGGEVDMLQYARERGVKAMGETCPQYLFFTVDDLRREDGTKWICSPPMRSAEDNNRLWEGLSRGILQTIGTDHCPFFYDGTRPIVYEGREIAIPGKELGKGDFTKIPNGLPGIEDRLPVFILVIILAASSLDYAQDLSPITLPGPKTDGGKPLMEALKARSSAREFGADRLPAQTMARTLKLRESQVIVLGQTVGFPKR